MDIASEVFQEGAVATAYGYKIKYIVSDLRQERVV
jgi:hypothetical protein